MWFIAGEEATLTVDYMVDGEFITPETASYRLLNSDGTVAVSGSLPAVSTSEMVAIPAAQTSITEEYETRFLEVVYVYQSRRYSKLISFSLTAFLPLTGSIEDVRQTLGLDAEELRDRDVSLYDAYFDLRWKNGEAFKAGLTSGGQRAQATNRAVVLQAALKICISLAMRTHIVVQSEDSRVQRSSKIDFDRLRADIEYELAENVNLAGGITLEVVNLFALSNPEDPFSG